MNKKRLSVVMAGAMLASSVAPVLASEVQKSEVSANEKGLLLEELRTLLETNKFANDELNKDFAGKSVYKIYVNGNPALGLDDKELDVHSTQKDWQHVFNSLRVGDKVEVYSKGFKVVEGKGNYHFETTVETPVYKTSADLKAVIGFIKEGDNTISESYKDVVKDVVYDDVANRVVITLKDDLQVPGQESEKTIILDTKENNRKLKEGKVDAKNHPSNVVIGRNVDTLYYKNTSTNKEAAFKEYANKAVSMENFGGFIYASDVVNPSSPIASGLVKEYKITPGGYNYDVTDLYDGLFLTEKGKEFFGMLKDNVSIGREVRLVVKDAKGVDKGLRYTIGAKVSDSSVVQAEKDIKATLKDFKDNYRVEVRLFAKGDLKEEVYSISGKDLSNISRLASWMIKPQARVDILEGANRYETAANIAREYAGLTGDVTSYNGYHANIVLVNGNALVDGLAAAPLASKLSYNTNNAVKVPILLTEADALPKATKTYLKEVIKNIEVGNLKDVTIHLVGGESVLNKSLERELRGLGFDVERYGGANREETSLAVAKEMETNKAFVVGAEGEADAMSIASVAASSKTPIIVAKKGGISEDAVYALRDSNVTIIGGKAVVSENDENAIKAEANGVIRIKGSNRQATNAEIIKRYYKGGYADSVGNAKNIIVAKDGQRNKSELVDALAAANMASEKKAPIVLATNKLSKAQLEAIISNGNEVHALYQVGIGVDKENVVRAIARQLGLTNR